MNLILDEPDYCSGQPMSDKGFGYMWAGAKATYGATRGKVCFEVLIGEQQNVDHLGEELCPHAVRIGWSIAEASMQLGEDPFSYGFGGTGKTSQNSKFSDYGTSFSTGDVVGCFLDLTADPITVSYTVNSCQYGVAFQIDPRALDNRPLFPHILTKNQKFTVNFGQMPQPLSNLLPDFVPIGQLGLDDGLVRGPVAPESRQECQVLLMVGLPGAGKTFWAEEHRRKHPDKNFNILGTNNLIGRMKVHGLKRNRNYNGRWEVLIEKCTECFDVLVKIAAQRNRNYILDQTNVFPTGRTRKIKDFKGMMCKAVVIVPNDEEFKRRCEMRQREEGTDIPQDAYLQMKGNYLFFGKKRDDKIILFFFFFLQQTLCFPNTKSHSQKSGTRS